MSAYGCDAFERIHWLRPLRVLAGNHVGGSVGVSVFVGVRE